MNIILFGPPGAGKGTQAVLIQKHFDLPHLSTGEMFRTAIRNKTSLGLEVKSIMDSGELVPDEKVVALVDEELKKEKYADGAIFDGFPRTVAQAVSFDTLLSEKGTSVYSVIALQVPEEELIRRILSRGEGRSDDTEEAIRNRLGVYHRETAPVLAHYQQKQLVHQVDGTGSVETIFERIREQLEDN